MESVSVKVPQYLKKGSFPILQDLFSGDLLYPLLLCMEGIVPIPIRDEMEPGIQAAMKISMDSRSNVYKSWSGQVITDR